MGPEPICTRSSRGHRLAGWLAAAALLALLPEGARAHSIYVMNDNHTDYNWNATAAAYDAAMLLEMDFYLQQVAATAGAPPEEQARYTPDNWWWLWLYEKNRTPEQFQQLLDAIESEHITIPLNPFVTLYGALPTEAAIRAGYYPGRVMRRHGIRFPLAEDIENSTNPWGLASLWAGSGVRYTWKGICGCWHASPPRSDLELFHWKGPDASSLIFKWYEFLDPAGRGWGGYSEARDSLLAPDQLDFHMDRTRARMPGIGVTGLFGAGWDDVTYQSNAVLDAVVAYNAAGGPDRAIVSNGIDFFQQLEGSGETGVLGTLQGGWGNDWDMWPASLAARTARVRRALERLRLAEALAALVQTEQPAFWTPVRDQLELGLTSVWKYFEHGWAVAPGGPSLTQMAADKLAWAQDIETAVDGAVASAGVAAAALFQTTNENRLVVFNPLGFTRTDVAHAPVPSAGSYVIVDVATGMEAPSQVVVDGGAYAVRFLASDVPSLGYRVYRIASGTPAPLPAAAVVDPVLRTIESATHRVTLGTRGQIVELLHKAPGAQLAGSRGLNDFGSGSLVAASPENVGPVSATLRLDLGAPARTVRVTLYRDIDRVEVEDEILENVSGFRTYSFHANLPGAQIRFEEVGAIARPGLVTEGGSFLQGTRAGRMTLNHFTDFEVPGYHLVLSNADAFAMRVNDSTDALFDLTGDEVHVVIMEQGSGAEVANQGGDSYFLNRFALRGIAGAFDAAESMRTSLAHQNPLHVLSLPRNQAGPLTAPVDSLVSIDRDDVVITAFKPAEDGSLDGFIVRAWDLGGAGGALQIDASRLGVRQAWRTTLIETDALSLASSSGTVSDSLRPWQIGTWRLTRCATVPFELAEEPAQAGIRLRWTAGTPPFEVRRGRSPDAGWATLTPPGGTTAFEWLDTGAATDGEHHFYVVREIP